ncbi:clathrin associated protein complex medium subunit [Zygosaccharomyces mellis]|uniref:Clathrin associated protein complex medium subunit n=1 Tax=Zygosaccharomyces mellis TaxID=42258 RepID=A0A4C2E3A9_9SACH|nr:clathrin associated protein complex medium subunit [Zygosaccharomyces mellis]
MINAVLIYSTRGELIVSKLFNNSLKRSISDIFRIQVINNLDVRSPILTLGSTTFHHIRSNGSDSLWLVTVSRTNANSGAIWEFLYKFNAILDAYGLTREEKLKEDFMLCYEILDIVLGAGGIPLDTELGSVVSKISVKPVKDGNNLSDPKSLTAANLSSPGLSIPKFLTRNNRSMSQDLGTNYPSSFSWRPNGIKYKKNEVFLYVNEKINILVSRDGSILKAYVDGTIDMTTHLSGTPICQFGLNDSPNVEFSDSPWLETPEFTNKKAIPKAAAGSVMLEDCKFHQCVSLDKFNKEGIIKFVPPDGHMELMKYCVRDNLNLPFKISPIVTPCGSAVEYRITLKSLFPNKLSAKDVALHIPVPPGTVDCKINISNGKCKFESEENAMVWRFNKYHGLTENTLSAITVPTSDTTRLTLQQWSRPSMSLDFEIVMFSNSGLVVRFFRVVDKDEKYRVVKWIKYISKSGSYEVRY